MILAIYGAGGMGTDILSLALQINKVQCRWENIIFVDDVTNQTMVRGKKVYSFKSFENAFTKNEVEFVIGVGEPSSREVLAVKVKQFGFSLAVPLINPTVYVSEDSSVGKGTVILANAYISSANIGENVAIMPMACIGHGCVIDNNCFICTGVALGGNSHICKNVFIAMLSAVKEKIVVGENSVISLNSAVLDDVPVEVVALGNPAKIIARSTKVFK